MAFADEENLLDDYVAVDQTNFGGTRYFAFEALAFWQKIVNFNIKKNCLQCCSG